MRAKKSNLNLQAFELLESHYEFIEPKTGVVRDVNALFAGYAIEIDFQHQFDKEGAIMVLCTIGVNTGSKPKAGYRMEVAAEGVFEIQNPESLDQNILSNLKFYSTLNMMINTLRNVMFQLSNLGPMKGYLLPPIDVLDLFKQKKRKVASQKKGQSM